MFATRWIERLDAGDRVLLDRWVIPGDRRTLTRSAWVWVTHAGGAVATIGAVLLTPLIGDWPRQASWRSAVALTVSHLVVQVLKRSCHRPRPIGTPAINCPDRFSFPSGHATAALAVSASFALAFPAYALPLLSFGLLVGWSRVVLGVHYPGDVVTGQLIALATVAATRVLA